MLKLAIIEELKRKALADYIPGVTILVGLAEDSLAAWQAIRLVHSGGRKEMAARAADLERKIALANRQPVQLGIKRAEMFDRMQPRQRAS